MIIGRIAALAVFLALLGTPAAPADKIVPRSGYAVAPLPTDETVRKGMLAIRDLVRINHSLVTHRRMPPDHAMRFAAQVKIEADRILATSTISSEARDRLHLLLSDIVAGVGSVAARDSGASPIDGLARADAALTRYPQEFDHPDWAPVQSLD
jgi:hypothetical protein